MKPVGIIANPASGKDIRRLIASGTVVTNQEKINMVVRMLKALDAVGVEQAFIMPDPSHMGQRVLDEVSGELHTTRADMLAMPYLLGTWKDSFHAAQKMRAEDFACIIVMGGDGTCRIVAKACGNVPMLPVSTGTNNVFPQMMEGTLAGLAAGVVASGAVDSQHSCKRAPILELRNQHHELIDTALVDVAVVDASDIGSRAVWEPDAIKELYLTMTRPAQIGLSSIGSWLARGIEQQGKGLRVVLDQFAQTRVQAPIAPGLIEEVGVSDVASFGPGESVAIQHKPSVIALDGEREIMVSSDETVTVSYREQGPLVLDVDNTLAAAAAAGLMTHRLDCRRTA